MSDLAQPKGYPKGYGGAAQEPTHLRDYLNVVLKRKWLILSLVVVVTSLVTIQMYRLPSIYEAQTTINIEPKRDNILKTSKDQIVINTGRSSDPAYVNTQLRLLENPALARQVIRKLDLMNNPSFFGGQAQAGFISSVRRILSGNKQPQKQAETDAAGKEALPVVTEKDVTDTQFSTQELERLEPYEDTLAANLIVEPVVGTILVKLLYRHTNPELAQNIVNTLADTFVQNNVERELVSSDNNYKLLSQRIAELHGSIQGLEQQRFNLARSTRLTDMPGGNILADKLAQYSKDLLEAEKAKNNARSLYDAAVSATDANAIPEVQENTRVQNLRKQLDELNQKRAELLVTYTEDWPAVVQINEKIAKLNEELTKAPQEIIGALKKRYEAADARERRLRGDYARQYGETGSQGLAQIKMTQLKDELESQKQEYATLRQRQRELENAATDRYNNVSVSTYARMPRSPVGPPRLRTILLAFLLAIGAGVGLAFLLDYLDDTLKTVDDVDRYIHLPALALIPAARSERGRLKGRAAPAAASESTALALAADVRSPVAEAYRHLRTSLLLSSAGQPPKTILVTSSQPSEGKTTTASNTAIMLAQTGAKVLIVDCDLRRPRLHANFGVSNARGLTNCLSGEKNFDALVQQYDKLPNLEILTSGPVPPNPAELLGSNEMRRLLHTLSERYTHIVIDSPPAISFTDASILSTLVDGVMLVVHGGRSSRAVVRRAKQQLTDVGANIFGVVLNNVKLDSHSPDYYYSGYYSNYYSNEEEQEAREDAATAGANTAR